MQHLRTTLVDNKAGYLLALNRIPEACAATREVIRNGDTKHPGVAIAIEHLALALAIDGDIGRAALLSGYSDFAFSRARLRAPVHGANDACAAGSVAPGLHHSGKSGAIVRERRGYGATRRRRACAPKTLSGFAGLARFLGVSNSHLGLRKRLGLSSLPAQSAINSGCSSNDRLR
jgi:hypothetical protein